MHDSMVSNLVLHRTPKKIKRIDGLLTLSSSSKKLSLKNVNRKRFVTINMDFTYGLIKRDLFSKFLINIFQYILYDKNAIPIPFNYFDKLEKYLNEQAKKSWKKRALLSTFSKLNLIFDFITNLFLQNNIYIGAIALCLGDSIRFAKEIFIINIGKLNLSDEYKNDSNVPFLTLRYMIDCFYRRLLNEIPEEMPPEKPSELKAPKNIMFAIKVTSSTNDNLSKFIDNYSNENQSLLQENSINFGISDQILRLGSIISNITNFKFGHNGHILIDNFDIFIEDNDVEEVIEEKIELEDEVTFMNSSDNSSPSKSAEDKIAKFKNNEKIVNEENSNSLLFAKESKFWIQIGPPIPCILKL